MNEQLQKEVADNKLVLAQEAQAKELALVEGIAEFDWKKIPPPAIAQILVRIPFKGSSGEPDFYLKPWQAMIFAIRCYELGLSPFSGEVWYNPKNNKVNVTFEGKLKLARDRGYNFGPPHFESKTRPWKNDVVKKQMIGFLGAGFDTEPGLTCVITVDGKEKAEYTAWLSEWMVLTSPVWKSKPMHMLQVRAHEKCISFASGVGASELPEEKDIEPAVPAQLPEISITEKK